MPTEKQIAAHRPNSLKHGLAAQLTVLPFESQADYDQLEQNPLEDIQPPTLAEGLRIAQKPSPDPFEGLALCMLESKRIPPRPQHTRTHQAVRDMDLTSTVRSTEGRSECRHQISDGLTNTR